MEPHECINTKKIDSIEKRLGNDNVSIKLMSQTQNDHTLILQEIRDQTKMTNGRVTRLEGWKKWVLGLCVGLGITGAPEIIKIIKGMTNEKAPIMEYSHPHLLDRVDVCDMEERSAGVYYNRSGSN